MSNVSKMKAMWAKKKVGDLVCIKDGCQWPGTSKFPTVSKAGTIVGIVGSQFDVLVYVGGMEEKGKCTRKIIVAEGDVEMFLVVENSFKLAELPLPVLSCVMAQFEHLRDAALVASVCKKFLLAFRDEASWQRRCASELPGVVKMDGQSWMNAYREHGMWKIRVLTLAHSGERMSFHPQDDACVVWAHPHTTVGEFVDLLRDAKHNRQKKSVPLFPFNPAVLTLEKGRIPHEWLPHWPTPNCKWNDRDPSITIKEAGLCQEAVLARLDSHFYD